MESFWSNVFNSNYLYGAGISSWKFSSDGLGASFFCLKKENMQPVIEKMDAKVFFERLSRLFSLCKYYDYSTLS